MRFLNGSGSLALLAIAENGDSSTSIALWLLMTLGVVFVTTLLGLFVTRLARSRRPRHAETLMAVVVVWALITAASVSYTLMKHLDWNAQLQQRIMSGYYDPAIDNADKPKNPIALWVTLGASYLAMMAWIATGSTSTEQSHA